MLTGLNILIAEDQALLAIDLADYVQGQGAHVIGPADTVSEALALAERVPLAAAILDANLLDRDVTPLALDLIARRVPFVVYTGTGLPEALAQSHPALPVVMKPAPLAIVIAALEAAIDAVADGSQPMRLEMPGRQAHD